VFVNILCAGISADTVDVLKLADSSEEDVSDSGVVSFDGSSVAVDIQQDDVFGSSGLGRQFTVSTWLRHEHGNDDRVKQHIMCSSDAEGLFGCLTSVWNCFSNVFYVNVWI